MFWPIPPPRPSVCPHSPWDSDLPDDVEEMKLILHMWVALFYRKPTRLLSSHRKVVEHNDPKKYVLINSSQRFLRFGDTAGDTPGLETCPADSRSDPDQTPSSSLDPSSPSQGSFPVGKSLVDSRNGDAGVDSTVSSSSGELPCQQEEEEEEPSSTSCPESLPEGGVIPEENLDMGDTEPVGATEPGVVEEFVIVVSLGTLLNKGHPCT
ncbi:hypothetical protein WISP_00799 [Willisornis vidua]|uniref:Uncharacterized protein n=1 Tax=Willisornis vidua TaxID=1566151 RepID=A0ABQ9E0P8_9PASS|nr:hypothetical protein WISP_00799 [Willisornis vidua]